MAGDMTFVSASDETYFPYLQGTVLSIRHKPQGKNVSFQVIDLGLTRQQIRWLKKHDVAAKKVDWDLSFAKPPPEYLKAMTARPHLEKHFPGFAYYFWIDADAWVQDWSAVELYRAGAEQKGFAVCAELSRCYIPFFARETTSQWQYKNLRSSFGETFARALQPFPIINSGVFCAASNSVQMQRWSDMLGKSAQTKFHFFTEQTALNVAVYHKNVEIKPDGISFLINGADYMGALDAALLPATCNWLCNRALPRLAADRTMFVEPLMPHRPIGIIHMASRSGAKSHTLQTLEGEHVEAWLNYPETGPPVE